MEHEATSSNVNNNFSSLKEGQNNHESESYSSETVGMKYIWVILVCVIKC